MVVVVSNASALPTTTTMMMMMLLSEDQPSYLYHLQVSADLAPTLADSHAGVPLTMFTFASFLCLHILYPISLLAHFPISDHNKC